MTQRGLSPRGRGSRTELSSISSPDGSIPAWAGEPALRGRALARPGVYPRVGGGASL